MTVTERTKSGVRASVAPEDVLREAAVLFCRDGYEKTRMKDIAARFNVTHAALYYHFSNKQEILVQINLRAVDEPLASARRVAAMDEPVDVRFRGLLYDHILWVAQNGPLASAFFDFDGDLPPDVLKQVKAKRREFTTIFETMYDEAVQVGLFTPANKRLAVACLLGAGNWVYRWYDPRKHHETPVELAETYVRILEAGFRKEPSLS